MTAPAGDAPASSEPSGGSLSAGRVGRPHGLDGSFYVTRPRARLLGEGAVVSVGERQTRIERRAGTDAHPIVRVEGVGDREQALALRGQELLVSGADAPALGDGEWWAHELEGCRVYAAGRELGRVRRLLELPSCEVLEVALTADPNAPLLVPMVKDALLVIAPREDRIEVDPDFLGLGEDASR